MTTNWQDYNSNHQSLRMLTNTTHLARCTSMWIIGIQMASVTVYSAGVIAGNISNLAKIELYARELILKISFQHEYGVYLLDDSVDSVLSSVVDRLWHGTRKFISSHFGKCIILLLRDSSVNSKLKIL